MARPAKPENAWLKKAGLRYVTRKRGQFVYRPYLGDGSYGPLIVLGPATAKPQEIIRRYEEILRAEQPAETVDWLLGYYMKHGLIHRFGHFAQKLTKIH